MCFIQIRFYAHLFIHRPFNFSVFTPLKLLFFYNLVLIFCFYTTTNSVFFCLSFQFMHGLDGSSSVAEKAVSCEAINGSEIETGQCRRWWWGWDHITWNS
jgi:hypothetical protein